MILDMTRCRLWFADFYCNYTTHYVTVVVTVSASPPLHFTLSNPLQQRGSDTDRYCERSLVPLDLTNNPFVQCRAVNFGQFVFQINKKVWVEVGRRIK